MTDKATRAPQRIFTALAYRDANAAIEFLCDAFGLEKRFATPADDDGRVMHAELELDGNVVMVGSTGVGLDIRSPAELEATRLCMYVRVADPDAHHARATAAGAEIVRPLRDTDYGSREYVCRDPEGNLWSFGTYDPLGWAVRRPRAPGRAPRRSPRPVRARSRSAARRAREATGR